jgi:hypothetical protein
MKTMTEAQLNETSGGGDSLAKDIGQFVGGMAGWFEANTSTYFLLGPGIGGLAAIQAGLRNAAL